MATPEGKVSREIQDGLKQLGFRVIRINSGVVRVRGGMLHGAPKGTPDLLCFDRYGVILWIEVKAALGKPSAEQIEFHAWAVGMGHRVVMARSLAEVMIYLSVA